MQNKFYAKYSLGFLWLSLLVSCGQVQDNRETSIVETDSTIVLVNYKSADRATIAKGIEVINKCNPRIIGINALFLEIKNIKSDSLLSRALSEKNNVVLAINGKFSNTGQDTMIHSNNFFVRNALSEGLVYYGYSGDNVTSHLPLKSVGNKLIWSFPREELSL